MKKCLFLVLSVCLFGIAQAQPPKMIHNPYKFGVGVGYNPSLDKPYVITAKYYFQRGGALEFMGFNEERFMKGTLYFTPNISLTQDGNWRLLVGPGLHVGKWYNEFVKNSYTTNPIVGGDLIFGTEFRIPKIPLSFQLHYLPSVDFVGNDEFFYFGDRLGVAVKFIIGK